MAAKPQLGGEITVKELDLGGLTEMDHSTLDTKNFTYRWASKAPLKIARLKAKGYVIVDPSEEPGIKNVVGDSPEAEDGTYSFGDVILMKCPKARFRARRHEVAQKAKARLRGPVKKFKRKAENEASRRGIDIEVITDKEPKEK